MVQQLSSSSSSGGNFPQPSPTVDSNSRIDYLYPEMLVRFRVNHVAIPNKTVDIDLKLSNIKVDDINETLNRISTYLQTAIAQDLNPGVVPPEGIIFT